MSTNTGGRLAECAKTTGVIDQSASQAETSTPAVEKFVEKKKGENPGKKS